MLDCYTACLPDRGVSCLSGPACTADSVLARAGVEHDLLNTGDVPLRILMVWGPPGQADFSDFGSAQAARAAKQTGDLTRGN